MSTNEEIPMPEEALEDVFTDENVSVEDFMKQLEERERDLHITADLSIEIEDHEFDPREAYTKALASDDGVELPMGKTSVPGTDAVPTLADQEAPPAGGPGLKTQVYELQQEIAKLNKRIEELKAERNEIQEKSDRRLKDFESFKYRVDRERRGAFIEQISNLATQMLPVLDNLDRAIDSASGTDVAKSEDFQRFYDGIVLVNQQVREVFADMGVEPIAAVGKEFDPNLHEAVAIADDPDRPANTIVEELLPGYKIGNRVIRHSMVKVTPSAKSRRVENSDPAPETTLETVRGEDDPMEASGAAADGQEILVEDEGHTEAL